MGEGATPRGRRARSAGDAACAEHAARVAEAWAAVRASRPKDRAGLRAWLAEWLGVRVPRGGLIGGHDGPLDYLCFAFFEEQGPGGSRDCVVWANRGGGKTFLAAAATLLDLVFKDGIEVRILGGSLDQSRRMYAHLRALVSREPFALLVDGKISRTRLALSNGSSVELLAQSQTSVRGTRVQKLRCDEVELFDEEVWEAAQLATREKVCGGQLVRGSIECLSTMHLPYGLMHRLVGQCRPERGGGQGPTRALFRWGAVDVLGRCGDEHTCERDDGVRCPLWEECRGRAKQRGSDEAGHIGVGEALRLKARVSLAQWRSEMLCLRPRRRDCVLPEFDPAAHVFDDGRAPGAGEDGALWICGVDFGIRSPGVVLWAQLDEDGVLRVVDERVREDEPLAAHGRAMLEAPWPRPVWVGVDPAGVARSIQTGISDVQALREMGLLIKARRLPREAGLELLRARLRPADGTGPRLLVHRRCGRLIESMERYRYPSERPEAIEPVKDGSDHAVDALRYMIQNLDAAWKTAHGRYA